MRRLPTLLIAVLLAAVLLTTGAAAAERRSGGIFRLTIGEPAAAGGPSSEAMFPGGLADDGRGSDDLGEPVAMDDDAQYEANIFLSNFAEQFFGDYAYTNEDLVNRVIDFAHIWYKINNGSAISYRTLDGTPYEVLTLDQINAVVGRYFPFVLDDWHMTYLYFPTEHSFWQDGALFFEAADGEAYNRFAVADSLTRMPDGSYYLNFTVYEIDIAQYFDEGVARRYYRMTPAEASSAPELTPVRYGAASALPHEWYGRDSYQLLEYSSWSPEELESPF